MKKYYAGYIWDEFLQKHGTEKAFYVDYDTGHWGSGHERHIWIPKSICQFGELTECGWRKIFIPMWFIIRNRLEWKRLDINWCGNGEPLLVEL